MDGLNRVILLGNLGTDPELRYTPQNTPLLTFRLATTESWPDRGARDGREAREPGAPAERVERTEWHTVTVWGARGVALSRILAKGSSVLVEGSLRTSSYEKDGQKRFKTEVIARDVVLAGRRREAPDARSTERTLTSGLEPDALPF